MKGRKYKREPIIPKEKNSALEDVLKNMPDENIRTF